MFNALYVSPCFPLNDFDIFIKENIHGINALFIDSEYFFDIYLNSISDINEFHIVISKLFNNAFYKSYAPITSDIFTSALIEYVINNNKNITDSFALLWHYDVKIFLTDPDRLNSLLSISFNSEKNLLSSKEDEDKIHKIYENVFENYLLTSNYRNNNFVCNILFNAFIEKYIGLNEIKNIILKDKLPVCSNKNKYSEL